MCRADRVLQNTIFLPASVSCEKKIVSKHVDYFYTEGRVGRKAPPNHDRESTRQTGVNCRGRSGSSSGYPAGWSGIGSALDTNNFPEPAAELNLGARLVNWPQESQCGGLATNHF